MSVSNLQSSNDSYDCSVVEPNHPEFGQVPISTIPIHQVSPSPENDRLYAPVNPDDPEIISLAESIQEFGIQEPLLVTNDLWIVSGHRRYAAAELANLEAVPCRVLDFDKDDDPDKFMRLLRECNRQRIKSFDEKVREEVVSANPEEAYESLIAYRATRAEVDKCVQTIVLGPRKSRSKISKAKQTFLDAVKAVLKDRFRFWPLSDRQIHYALLNNPPLRHASKPDSRYDNTPQSYKALTDLLTRARLEGSIPMDAIADQTRPVKVWKVSPDPQLFVREEIDGFLKAYWRDLMQSQPNHIEIIGEKNTILPIIRPIAGKFTLPMTIGRGFCSLPPRVQIAERFRKSGKEKLILLILSDFDPDGQEIARSLAKSMRDDFGIEKLKAIQVALTGDQVAEFDLPPIMQAKKTSSNYSKFAKEHGDNAFELEAIPPESLQKVLTEAIDAVIDKEAFNHELDQEKEDAAELETKRRQVHHFLGGME